ncbi:hypothetical protein [Devriesea agamarum]|uniref:hypothetical protein n=1 Tax=Devriesea agamarum TaxID=472569 RepID=UPI00071C3038|nr:hypothetical protein [Devriesea agamarum]
MNIWYELGALVPSIGVGLLFWFVIRALLRADRRQREAERAIEAEYALAARAETPTVPSTNQMPSQSGQHLDKAADS